MATPTPSPGPVLPVGTGPRAASALSPLTPKNRPAGIAWPAEVEIPEEMRTRGCSIPDTALRGITLQQLRAIGTLCEQVFSSSLYSDSFTKRRITLEGSNHTEALYRSKVAVIITSASQLVKDYCQEAAETGTLTSRDGINEYWKLLHQYRLELVFEVFVAWHKVVARTPANLYHICDHIVKPLTKPFRCSWVELVATQEQRPKTFVSHWWGGSFKETIAKLAFHAERRGFSEETDPYWICTYANNQHDLSSLGGGLEDTPFVRAIRDPYCQGTVALVDPKVTMFQRIWCVLELDISIKEQQAAGRAYFYDIASWIPDNTMDFGTDVAEPVPASAVLRLDRGGGTEETVSQHRGAIFPPSVSEIGISIEVASAVASVEADRVNILHYVAGTPEAQRSSAAPAAHPSYKELDRRLHRRFVPGVISSIARTTGAVDGDKMALLDSLLQQFPDVVEAQNNRGESAAYSAASYDNILVLEKLLQARADPNLPSLRGETPVYAAAGGRGTKALQLLLGARGNAEQRSSMGVTPLWIAACEGKVGSIDILLQVKADLSAVAQDGSSPLYAAALQGKASAAEHLLKARAAIDQSAHDGTTAAFVAAQGGHHEALAVLLKARADPMVRKVPSGATALHLAAQQGYGNAIQELLQVSADMEATTVTGHTPIFLACLTAKTEAVRVLLEGRANPSPVGNDGMTPLFGAACHADTAILKLLLEGRAAPNVVMADGATALFYAASYGPCESIEILLQANADANLVKEVGGPSILHIVLEQQKIEAVPWLLQARADVNYTQQDGTTALHIAQEIEDLSIPQSVLEALGSAVPA